MPKPKKELRHHSCELRAVKDDSGKLYLRGYAVVADQRSVDLGGFTETIAPGAFAEVLKRDTLDVVALFNHDSNNVLGRTPNTLRMNEDDKGLFVDIELPDTELGRSVYTSIERGDIQGQSFAFIAEDDEWSPDFSERRVTKVRELYDVGPVTYPAYPDTTIAARSRELAMSQAKDEAQKQEPKQEFRKMDKELLAKADEILKRANDIEASAAGENRDLTDDETTSITELVDERSKVLKRRDALLALKASNDNKPAVQERQAPVQAANSPKVQEVRSQRVVVMPRRTNLRSFKPEVYGGVANANEAAHRAGMFFAASIYGNQRAQNWCRENGLDVRWSDMDSRAMAANINASGGYLVPDEIETAVINIRDDYGLARQVCRRHGMMSDTKNVPIRKSGLTATPVGENAALTESDKSWGNAELVARKWGTITRYSNEVAEDSIIDMGDDLTLEIALAFAYGEDNAWLNGDGTNAYHGIKGIQYLIENDQWTTCVLAAASGHDTLAEIDHDDLALCYGKLPQKYIKQGAGWLCHPLTKAAVFDALMVAAGGNMNTQVANGQPATYMGYPIYTNEAMYTPATPTTAANGKVPILFGAYGVGCSFGDRRGMTVAMSDQRYFEYDQIAIRGIERFDIANHNANPVVADSEIGAVVGLELTT